MAKECFCGCGREVPFGRKRAANLVGAQFDKDLALFAGSVERTPDAEHDTALTQLVDEGRRIREQIRNLVHGTLDRKDFDKDASGDWLKRANEHRGRLAKEVISEDYVGWNAHKQSQLLRAGARANATIVEIEDTGTRVNDNPRVRLKLRVEPEGADPFALEKKVTVSLVSLPRRGERVEVVYDPEDPSDFTFRMADLSDDPIAAPATDRVAQLERLADLRERGVLSQEEFEAEKRRLLESPDS